MIINISNQSGHSINIKNTKAVLKEIIKIIKPSYKLAHNLKEINLIFLSSSEIEKLNYKFLKKNYPTDVLTFPDIAGEVINGDIAICPDEVIKNAKHYKKETEYLLQETILHACLHLVGLEHDYEAESLKELYRVQDALLSNLSELTLEKKILKNYEPNKKVV